MNIKILGIQKLTLLDYPAHIAADIFLGGCNFRCPFCQNSSLVLTPELLPEYPMEEFYSFLKKRQGILDGICVTGGEPTLHRELPELLSMLRELNYLIKLDTNGTNPEMLQELLRQNLLDYVAIDIKAGRPNYANVAGLQGCQEQAEALLARVCRSVELIMAGGIEYEFRTTVVKGLHTAQDFEDIGSWLSGCRHYYLQSFRDCEEVLLSDHSFSAFEEEKMQEFLSIVQKTIPNAKKRPS